MNKVKVIKIAVPACICAVALIILAAVLMNGKDSKTWKDYYDLGMQYLKEENYEEAIVAFTSAIELDSRQAIVYIGRGDAYAGLAEREESKGNLEEAEELYENAADDYEQAIELGEKEEAADKLKRIQAAIDRLAEKIADLEEDQMDSQEQENAVDESSESGNNDNTTAANTGTSSGNQVNTNTNTNVNTNTRPGGMTTENPVSEISDFQKKVYSYVDTFHQKTRDDIITDFGAGYELRNTGVYESGYEHGEFYYADEGIGFGYYEDNASGVYQTNDFIIYSDKVDVGYGLRGGMTYPELAASFTGETIPNPPEQMDAEEWGAEWYTNCLVSGNPETGEGWVEACYEWQDNPDNTPGVLHLGYVRT